MRIALSNGRAFIAGKLAKRNILVENGKITEISRGKIGAEKEIECKNRVILTGAIDCHVHFRSPGLEYKEDMVSGSLAAIHGGVTTVMDMPNTLPPTITIKALEEKRSIAARDCAVNFDAYMGATENNIDEIRRAKGLKGVKLYYGSSTGNMLFNEKEKIAKLFEECKRKNIVVVAHAEDENEIAANMEKYRSRNDPAVHALIRSDIAEEKAIRELVGIAKKTGNRLHIAHLSSKKGLEAVKKAKKARLPVSCEVSPNHLFLNDADYKRLGNPIKCNPSIKTAQDQKALWQGLVKGDIDIVATDHAPHALGEKMQGYKDCPSGIAGLETMLPLLLDAAARRKIKLARAIDACCSAPARLFGWNSKGFIGEGFDADLVIVDVNRAHRVENDRLFTKALYSPFNGMKLKGFIEKTIVGGEVYG